LLSVSRVLFLCCTIVVLFAISHGDASITAAQLKAIMPRCKHPEYSQTASFASHEHIRNGDYYAVRWEDNRGVSVVKRSAVHKPPDNIRLFEQRML
jgi:hypothetical protein